jgi:hypothetical protein
MRPGSIFGYSNPISKNFLMKNWILLFCFTYSYTYSRNSIFSGLLPIDIAKRFPDYWVTSSEMDNSRNRNEHQLLDEHIEVTGL